MLSNLCHLMNNVRHTERLTFVRLDWWYFLMMDMIPISWFCHVFGSKILNDVRAMSCQYLSMCYAYYHCSVMIHDNLNHGHDEFATLNAAHQIDFQCLSYLCVWRNFYILDAFRIFNYDVFLSTGSQKIFYFNQITFQFVFIFGNNFFYVICLSNEFLRIRHLIELIWVFFIAWMKKIKLNYTYLQSSCQIISVISGWKYGNFYFEKKICAKLSKNCKKEWE